MLNHRQKEEENEEEAREVFIWTSSDWQLRSVLSESSREAWLSFQICQIMQKSLQLVTVCSQARPEPSAASSGEGQAVQWERGRGSVAATASLPLSLWIKPNQKRRHLAKIFYGKVEQSIKHYDEWKRLQWQERRGRGRLGRYKCSLRTMPPFCERPLGLNLIDPH